MTQGNGAGAAPTVGRVTQAAALLDQVEAAGTAYLAALARHAPAAERLPARQAWQAALAALTAALSDLDHRAGSD